MSTLLRWLPLLLIPLACSATEQNSPDNLTAGKDYQTVSPAQPTADPAKIEVVEVFWYGCPHCYHLEPSMERWLKSKPDDVRFVRMPATLNNTWRLHAQAYYTAEVLGVEDKVHLPMFKAIHEQGLTLNTKAALAGFFNQFGVDESTFHKTFDSFAVESRLQRTDKLLRSYKISSVPTLVVNGKYWTNGKFAGSSSNMLDVVDQLVERERRSQ